MYFCLYIHVFLKMPKSVSTVPDLHVGLDYARPVSAGYEFPFTHVWSNGLNIFSLCFSRFSSSNYCLLCPVIINASQFRSTDFQLLLPSHHVWHEAHRLSQDFYSVITSCLHWPRGLELKFRHGLSLDLVVYSFPGLLALNALWINAGCHTLFCRPNFSWPTGELWPCTIQTHGQS